jgi:regulator of sigma E protease
MAGCLIPQSAVFNKYSKRIIIMNQIAVVLIIGMIILIHEAGHFIAARLRGIPIEIFSIGYGPAVYKRVIGETEFRISIIPLGGYVIPKIDDENSYFLIPIYDRIILALGGPLANILLSIILFSIFNTLKYGPLPYIILIEPIKQTFQISTQILSSISNLFSEPGKLTGFIGIVSHGSGIIKDNLLNTIKFSALLSINLAIFNILPLPALDGGKVIMGIIEFIHPKLKKIYVPAGIASWILIAGLMFFATANDIIKLLS